MTKKEYIDHVLGGLKSNPEDNEGKMLRAYLLRNWKWMKDTDMEQYAACYLDGISDYKRHYGS